MILFIIQGINKTESKQQDNPEITINATGVTELLIPSQLSEFKD
jgi:hypothetical protein